MSTTTFNLYRKWTLNCYKEEIKGNYLWLSHSFHRPDPLVNDIVVVEHKALEKCQEERDEYKDALHKSDLEMVDLTKKIIALEGKYNQLLKDVEASHPNNFAQYLKDQATIKDLMDTIDDMKLQQKADGAVYEGMETEGQG